MHRANAESLLKHRYSEMNDRDLLIAKKIKEIDSHQFCNAKYKKSLQNWC